MPIQTLEAPLERRRSMPSLAVALATLASCTAWADEPIPYRLGASESITHDSNVYRTPDGPSGTYSSTNVFGGFDQMLSRQRVYGNARVSYNRYLQQSTLDNTSYGAGLGLDWATLYRLSGSINLEANQSLANLNGNATQPVRSRNVLKTDQISTRAAWGGSSLLSVQGSYAHSRVRYSAQESLSSQSSADAVSLGLYHGLTNDIQTGLALRYTRTDSPYAIAVVPNPTGPNDYRSNVGTGRNLDLTFNWNTTTRTSVNARVSFTRQSNSSYSGLDFSGLTGSLTATYMPTARLGFNLTVNRDAGTNASFFNVPTTTLTPGTPVSGLAQNSQTTTSYSLGATYSVTAKISANAGVQYYHGKLVNSFAGSNGMAGNSSDNTTIATLGANYAVARNWQLGCNVAYTSRSLSGQGSYSYNANSVGCSAQVTLL